MASNLSDFEPPPAYSEQDLDQKTSAAIGLSPTISEELEEWDEDKHSEAESKTQRAASSVSNSGAIATTSQRAVRQLPVPPRGPREGSGTDKSSRSHKKAASHSYGSSTALITPKPRPKWCPELDLHEEVSSARNTGTSLRAERPSFDARERSVSPPPAFSAVAPSSYSEASGRRSASPSLSSQQRVGIFRNASSASLPMPQHRFTGPKRHYASSIQSFPISPTPSRHDHTPSQPSPSRSSSPQLYFNPSVAYSRSNSSSSSVSARSTNADPSPASFSFNPNSFYNSAVSSHIQSTPSASSPVSLHKQPHSPRSIISTTPIHHFTAAKQVPPHIASISVPRAQSPTGVPHSANAPRFSSRPSFNAAQMAGTGHDRWATSENQYLHT